MANQSSMLSKTLVIGIILLFIVIIIFPSVAVDTVNVEHANGKSSSDDIDWWPMFHHDLNNTGNSSCPEAPENPCVRWYVQIGWAWTSPAVVNDKVYIGSMKEKFYCIDAKTGDKIWENPIPGGVCSSSPCVVDGKVYVGGNYDYIYCWDADTGDLIWKYSKKSGCCSSPAVTNCKLYIARANGPIYCLDAETGEEIWKNYDIKKEVSSLAVSDGKIYIGSADRRLYCFNAENGTKLWEFDMNGYVFASPCVSDGKVYCGGGWTVGNSSGWNGTFHCLDADTGEEIWHRNISNCYSSPAISQGDYPPYEIYFVAGNGNITCLIAWSGQTKWEYPTGSSYDSSSPAVADGKVYVGVRTLGELWCLEADSGELLWKRPVSNGNYANTAPAIANGTIYITGGGIGKLWAFWDPPSDPPLVPIIDGPTNGTAGVEYNYTFYTTDPNGDNVSYKVDWGDGNSYWYGPYLSGENTTISHSWSISGNYSITAKAMDEFYVQSNWSEPFNVSFVPAGPPPPPSNPWPYDNATDVDVNANLYWECEEICTYNVYFEADDSTPDVLVSENQSQKWYNPGFMNYTTQYYWQIEAWNIFGNTIGPVWKFTTEENIPPVPPYNSNPEDNATDIDVNANLSWWCYDPDYDNLLFDVYFQANDSNPEMVSYHQSEYWYVPGTMNYSTHYYWKIVAWDSYGLGAFGPVWNFTTTSDPNDPPYIPSDPDPENNAVNVDIDVDLSWVGGDPDENDTVVYDVYFEANDSTPDNQVANDISETTFDPGTLDYETIYYWQVIAKDNHIAITSGPVWSFITGKKPEADLSCDGSLSWTSVKPAETVEDSFTIENIGDAGSLLDWEIESYPDWGTWTFEPSTGYNLTPETGAIILNVSVVAPDEKNQEFEGEVIVVNLENPSNNCTIDVSLATPRYKPFNFRSNLLGWLLERFPMLERLLSLFRVI